MSLSGTKRVKPRWSSQCCSRGGEPAGDTNAVCHGFKGGVSGHKWRVVSRPKVVTVYWDQFLGAAADQMCGMNQFVDALISGTYMAGLAQYGVGLGALVASVAIDMAAYPAPKSLGEGDIEDQLRTWIKNGVLPAPLGNETNQVYLIFPPRGTKLTLDGDTAFCGYHAHTKYNASTSRDNLFWAVVHSELAAGQGLVGSISWCVSHELAEAFSNPDDDGYYNSDNGCEISDIGESAPTFPYLGWSVEQYWSQASASNFVATAFLNHTIRANDGTWPYAFGDVQAQVKLAAPNQDIGLIERAACSTDPIDTLHVCVVNSDGKLFHTFRKSNGAWPAPFDDIQAHTKLVGNKVSIGATPFVACAATAAGDLHICALDQTGGLWHTIRKSGGKYPDPFGDIQAQVRLVGPNPGIGPTTYVACAVDTAGNLHVCAIDLDGGLWHTIRAADGTWPYAFGDVQAQTRLVGNNAGIGPIRRVACATNPNGDLHVCALDLNGGLFHTIRMADGSWPFAFGDVQAQTRLVGPNDGIGPLAQVDCSADGAGNLHICAIDQTAGLWHTMRLADGSWPYPFGDVQSQTRLVGPNPGIGRTPLVAAAASAAGALHVCAIAWGTDP